MIDAEAQRHVTRESALHQHGAVSLVRVSVAELAVKVVAPAIRDPGARQPTGVVRPGNHRCEGHPALHWKWTRAVGIRRRGVAELSEVVVAPAVGGAREGDTARVRSTGDDRLEGVAAPDRSGAGVEGRAVAVTELPVLVRPPAKSGPGEIGRAHV